MYRWSRRCCWENCENWVKTSEAGNPLPHTINFVFKTGLKINISPLFPKAPPEADHAGGEDNKIAKALDDISRVFMKLIEIVILYAPIGFLVDPPATMVNATGDAVAAMMVTRLVEGKDWIESKMGKEDAA